MASSDQILLTLSQIANHPSPVLRTSTFGVILDATRPFKANSSSDYLTKLKIIDESFNPKASLSSSSDPFKAKKYFHLFIFSKSVSESPVIERIGDIIRIRRFDFTLKMGSCSSEWQGIAPSNKRERNWLIYSGNPGDSQPYSRRLENISELSRSDHRRLEFLRNWTRVFFKKWSIKELDWFTGEKEEEGKDMDIIGRIVKAEAKKQRVEQSAAKMEDNGESFDIVVVDEDESYYSMELKSFNFKGFSVGEIVKIRSMGRY